MYDCMGLVNDVISLFLTQANLRMLMGEFKLENKEKASMVIELMDLIEDGDLDYPLSYYIDAAKDFSTMEDAERGLIKECPICTMSYPVHEVTLSLSNINSL